MKKSIALLIALVVFLIPSVAFANTTEIAMVQDTQIENTAMDKLAQQMLQAKNESVEKEFKENHPELYEAINKTIDTPYGFNMNMNIIAKMDYPELETAPGMQIRRIFGQFIMNGYVNLPEEKMEMKMDIAYDAGELGNETIDGIKLLIDDNTMYMFNPMSDYWDVQDLDDASMFETTGNPMEQNNLAYMAPFADMMERRETSDSIIYSAKLTGDDLKTMLDEYAGMPIYDDLIAELSASGFEFEIPKIEMIYVLKDGVIRAQHTELDLKVITNEVTVNLVFAMDGEYYSYGLQKNIVKPEL